VEVGRHGDRALLIGGVDEAVEALGGVGAHRQEPDVVDLLRCRSKSTYPDPAIIPIRTGQRRWDTDPVEDWPSLRSG
jgi:hypothetical protein